MAEGARLESVFRGNSNVGSNPTLSAKYDVNFRLYSVTPPHQPNKESRLTPEHSSFGVNSTPTEF